MRREDVQLLERQSIPILYYFYNNNNKKKGLKYVTYVHTSTYTLFFIMYTNLYATTKTRSSDILFVHIFQSFFFLPDCLYDYQHQEIN